jgi:hypothetical protein
MVLWELLGRWQARENDPLHTRTDFMQLKPGLPEKCNQAAEYERGIDNLIRGLVDLLPKPDSVWPLDDRARWLRLAAAIFDVGYKAGDEHGEIGIACVTQDAASQPLDKLPALHPPSSSLMKRFDLGRGQRPMAAKKKQPDAAMSDLQAALDILESRIQHDKA